MKLPTLEWQQVEYWLEATNVPQWIDDRYPQGTTCRIIIDRRPHY